MLLGNLNADPRDGVGDHAAVAVLLGHPALTDPRPRSAGAVAGAFNPGASERATARLGEISLRLDYALPSRDLDLRGAGVFWPMPGMPGAGKIATGPAHGLVYVDVVPGGAGTRDP